MSFKVNKPSAVMIGRFQPWHEGHQALFNEAISAHEQVTILCESVEQGFDNPYEFKDVAELIRIALEKDHYTLGKEYIIMQIPRVAEISTGQSPDYEVVAYDSGINVSSSDIRSELGKYEPETVDVG